MEPVVQNSTAAEANNDKSKCNKSKLGKSGKKICCACPETKKERDECVVMNGESACAGIIEAHKKCLRAEGFQIA